MVCYARPAGCFAAIVAVAWLVFAGPVSHLFGDAATAGRGRRRHRRHGRGRRPRLHDLHGDPPPPGRVRRLRRLPVPVPARHDRGNVRASAAVTRRTRRRHGHPDRIVRYLFCSRCQRSGPPRPRPARGGLTVRFITLRQRRAGQREGGHGLLGVLVEPPAAPPARLASYMAASAWASRIGRSRQPPDSAMPTLTVNATGWPSPPVKRASGPVSRAAIWIARRLLIPRDHDDELVAAVAARDVVRPHVIAAGLRQVGQDPVARGVPVHVVDLLEVVHVQHQHEQGLAEPLRVREGGLGHLHEVPPVVQAGHPVDRGQFLVPDREPAVVPQRGELARADQAGQQRPRRAARRRAESKSRLRRPTTVRSR